MECSFFGVLHTCMTWCRPKEPILTSLPPSNYQVSKWVWTCVRSLKTYSIRMAGQVSLAGRSICCTTLNFVVIENHCVILGHFCFVEQSTLKSVWSLYELLIHRRELVGRYRLNLWGRFLQIKHIFGLSEYHYDLREVAELNRHLSLAKMVSYLFSLPVFKDICGYLQHLNYVWTDSVLSAHFVDPANTLLF